MQLHFDTLPTQQAAAMRTLMEDVASGRRKADPECEVLVEPRVAMLLVPQDDDPLIFTPPATVRRFQSGGSASERERARALAMQLFQDVLAQALLASVTQGRSSG